MSTLANKEPGTQIKMRHPAFIDMVEEAVLQLGNKATGLEIKDYIKSHYEIREDDEVLVSHINESLLRACEIEELERVENSTGEVPRFKLRNKAAMQQRTSVMTREGVNGPEFEEHLPNRSDAMPRD